MNNCCKPYLNAFGMIVPIRVASRGQIELFNQPMRVQM